MGQICLFRVDQYSKKFAQHKSIRANIINFS